VSLISAKHRPNSAVTDLPISVIVIIILSPPMSTTISLDEEVRLYSTNQEREKFNTLATLFGIIVALDYLERAYVRDSITAAECVIIIRWLAKSTQLVEILASMHTTTIPVQNHA
jgi:hypothetical protein